MGSWQTWHRHVTSEAIVAIVGAIAVALGASACGGAAKSPPAGAHTSATIAQQDSNSSVFIPKGQLVQGDGDADNPKDPDGNPDIDTTDGDEDTRTTESYDYPDVDDQGTLAYGHRPTLTERASIVAVATRYYAIAAQGDGAAACTLLIPSLARAVPEDYGSAGGPAYLRGGKTCSVVMSTLFRHESSQLSAKARVLSVRIKGEMAQVVLGSSTNPASLVLLERLKHSWYLAGLLGAPLP